MERQDATAAGHQGARQGLEAGDQAAEKEGEVAREGADAGETGQEVQDKILETDTAQHEGENADAKDESAAGNTSGESPGDPAEEPLPAAAENRRENIESEAVPVEGGAVENEADSKQSHVASADGEGSDSEAVEIKSEKPDMHDASQITADQKAAEQDLTMDAEGVRVEDLKPNTKDVSDEDSASTSGEVGHQVNTSDEAKNSDERHGVAVVLNNETVAPLPDNGEGSAPQSNESSIAAATVGAVKAAVVDASGVIKNATSDAIKNVKDALRTTLGDVVDQDNSSATAGVERKVGDSGAAEGEAGSEMHLPTAAAKRQDSPSKETAPRTVVNTSSAQAKDGTAASTLHDAAKPNASPESSFQEKDTKSASAAERAGKELKGRDIFAALIQRFPDASCLQHPDFQAFQSSLAHHHAATGGGGGTGSGGGDPHHRGPGGSGGGGGAKMEPIFAKITHEIKAVQITQHQHGQYLGALRACYEMVLVAIAEDLDSFRSDDKRRLENLERVVFLSQMESRGRRLPLYEEGKKLLRAFPATVSASRFISASRMPEGTEAILAGVSILVFLLLGSRLLRRKRPIKNTSYSPSISKSQGQGYETMESSIQHTSMLELVTPKELLEKENQKLAEKLNKTTQRLVDTQNKLSTLQVQHAALQQEHAALQQRATRQKQVVPDNRGDNRGNNQEEINQVMLSGISLSDRTPRTPTPSIQSEPLLEAVTTTKSIISNASPRKFRKKKSTKNKH